MSLQLCKRDPRITGSDGAFSLTGANAANFTLNPSTGAISYTAGGQITSDKDLTLTYTAAMETNLSKQLLLIMKRHMHQFTNQH